MVRLKPSWGLRFLPSCDTILELVVIIGPNDPSESLQTYPGETQLNVPLTYQFGRPIFLKILQLCAVRQNLLILYVGQNKKNIKQKKH